MAGRVRRPRYSRVHSATIVRIRPSSGQTPTAKDSDKRSVPTKTDRQIVVRRLTGIQVDQRHTSTEATLSIPTTSSIPVHHKGKTPSSMPRKKSPHNKLLKPLQNYLPRKNQYLSKMMKFVRLYTHFLVHPLLYILGLSPLQE